MIRAGFDSPAGGDSVRLCFFADCSCCYYYWMTAASYYRRAHSRPQNARDFSHQLTSNSGNRAYSYSQSSKNPRIRKRALLTRLSFQTLPGITLAVNKNFASHFVQQSKSFQQLAQPYRCFGRQKAQQDLLKWHNSEPSHLIFIHSDICEISGMTQM